MTNQTSPKPNAKFKALRVIAAILLNLAIVLSAVYVEYHILDHFNPMLSFINGSTLPIVPHLSVIIPVLFLLSVLLYDLLFVAGVFKGKRMNRGRTLLIILIDVILFVVFSLIIVTHSCNLLMRLGCQSVDEQKIVSVLATPEPTAVPETPVPTDTPAPTDAEPTSSETEGSEPPASAPVETAAPDTPAPTEIPGLLGSKYADKFTEEPTEQTFDASEVVETLADGTEKMRVYSYASSMVAVDIYRYSVKTKYGKLEYQFADIYIRDISCFTTHYRLNPKDNSKTQKYAEEIRAIVSTNGDNFNAGKIKDGLVIRNGAQLIPNGGKSQSKFSSDLCVLFYDGTMRVYDCKQDTFTYEEILANYPYQAFYFGPKLLNDDGTAKTTFNSSLGNFNPRTVLGYYEPGHYGLMVVLGTREMIDYNGKNHGNGKSPGIKFEELSILCEQLGFKMAYNLDGGGSSSMVWNKTVYGHNDRTHGDILAIIDPQGGVS